MQALQAICSWLSRALGDGENPSSSRLIAVPSLLAAYLVPLGVWAGLSIAHGKLEEVPTSLIGLIGTISTPVLGFLHVQKREENKP
jgi:hypothetical protein